MEHIISALMYLITIFFGGASLGAAIVNFKGAKYGGCGINLMIALVMIKLMFAI